MTTEKELKKLRKPGFDSLSQRWRRACKQAAVGNYGNAISIPGLLLSAAPSSPQDAASEMKGNLCGGTVRREDAAAHSEDRCMLGDLCARLLAWPPGPNIDCLFFRA